MSSESETTKPVREPETETWWQFLLPSVLVGVVLAASLLALGTVAGWVTWFPQRKLTWRSARPAEDG